MKAVFKPMLSASPSSFASSSKRFIRPPKFPIRNAFAVIISATGSKQSAENIVDVGRSGALFAQMLGAVAVASLRVLWRPRSFRFTSMVNQIDLVGWRAVPIILLITFLIGAILAQQGIFHFRKFGADVFVVDMVGILVLREVGVLIVCIMVAGRSGSAYTAELGSMKMREEIDALQTMGFDPISVLVLAAYHRARYRGPDADIPRRDVRALRSRPCRLALRQHPA